MRVHLLTEGFGSPNGRAFLFPLLVWRQKLRDGDIDIRFFRRETAELFDADLLIVDSKFFRYQWVVAENELVERFAAWKERCPLIFYDNSDSAGWLLHQALPVVDGYFKNQLLRDRTAYSRPLYGRRFYSDYYHYLDGVEDEQPDSGWPVTDPTSLDKLRVGWNSGLADYSLAGPLRMALFSRFPLKTLLRFPRAAGVPLRKRLNDLSCRFGTGYSRRTVAWQRLQIRERLGARCPTDKVGRIRYYRELCRSKVVVSPFGLGEITLKDFEVFLTGGLLLKPDMSHMETWPDFFRAGETCVMHRLDLGDLERRLEEVLSNDLERVAIAGCGQACYLQHTADPSAPEWFAAHLSALLRPFVRGS